MRVALVHDYLVHVRGGERVFEALAELYPQADVHAYVYDPGQLPTSLKRRKITTSFIQQMPFSRRAFRAYMALYPLAAITTDLTAYDLVISSSSAWAHAVAVAPTATMVCYCHSPFRYIWDESPASAGPLPLIRPFWPIIRSQLRRLDRRAAARVDLYIANSEAVRRKIRTLYGKESTVIWPPVDVDRFGVAESPIGSYFVILSALMPYKRIEIAVEAFNRLGWPLKIVGAGPDETRLGRLAHRNVSFLGSQTDAQVAHLLSGSRALVVTAEEDFGIAPLESMASGRPVVAYGAGGALESVVPGVTGIFYKHQTAEALIDALTSVDFGRFDSSIIRRHAEGFGKAAFRQRVLEAINGHLQAPHRRDARGWSAVGDSV